MRNEFEKKVEAFLKKQNLLVPGDRVLIGLSGGADSTCLAVVLRELAGGLSLSLGAFHVNHGIRGEEADRDEAFSEELCHRLGIPFYAVHEKVPERAGEWQTGLEEAGRRVRYAAAERILKEQAYTKIASAHHQNDVAETMLFHLFRGSSVGGLASIPVKRGKVIRPLLCCNRAEIEAYLKEKGIAFCTDSTNAAEDYTRNKIRHRMLAYAESEINEQAVRHMAETARELSEVEDYLTEETEKLCCHATETEAGVTIPAKVLAGASAVLRRRAIHALLGKVAGSKKDITRDHVEAVEDLLTGQSGRRVSLPYGLVAGRAFDSVYIRREEPETQGAGCEMQPVTVPGEYSLGDTGETLQFCLFSYKKNAEIPKNEYTKWFDYDKIKGTMCLRTYCAGDRLGMREGSKTVKSVWVEHKVPMEQRKRRLLLADEEQVIWIPGVRCCDNYRIGEETKTVLEVRRNGGRSHGSEC